MSMCSLLPMFNSIFSPNSFNSHSFTSSQLFRSSLVLIDIIINMLPLCVLSYFIQSFSCFKLTLHICYENWNQEKNSKTVSFSQNILTLCMELILLLTFPFNFNMFFNRFDFRYLYSWFVSLYLFGLGSSVLWDDDDDDANNEHSQFI